MHVVISVSANSTRFATCPTPTTASGTMHARTLSTAMSSAARGGTHVGMGSLGDAPTPAPAAADVPSLLPQLRSLLPGLNANTRVQAAAAAALSRTLADPATEPPAALAQLVKQCAFHSLNGLPTSNNPGVRLFGENCVMRTM
jgi:hypothetical protein